ncbi:MAG: 4Fe-4S binding protein, partial [Methanimicrococcus sp.]|nr:4Fe-4S binding protein [Methanimicrococcus sp.]
HWFPVFSFDKCIRCGNCVSSCPERILFLELQNSAIDQSFSFQSHFPIVKYPDFCRPNCFECVKTCQNNAVGILRPSKPCDCCSF